MYTPREEFGYTRAMVNNNHYLLTGTLHFAMMLVFFCKYGFFDLLAALILFLYGFCLQSTDRLSLAIFTADPLAKRVVRCAYIIGFIYALIGYSFPYEVRRIMGLVIFANIFILNQFSPLRRGTLNALTKQYIQDKAAGGYKPLHGWKGNLALLAGGIFMLIGSIVVFWSNEHNHELRALVFGGIGLFFIYKIFVPEREQIIFTRGLIEAGALEEIYQEFEHRDQQKYRPYRVQNPSKGETKEKHSWFVK